jgi:SAM-dependent methyltransferase
MFDLYKDRAAAWLRRRLNVSARLQSIARHAALGEPAVAAKIYPGSDKELWWLPNPPAIAPGTAPDAMPVPPIEFWEGYGRVPGDYLGSGRDHVAGMIKLLASDGFSMEKAQRVLDFGCSAGRMLRWLAPFEKNRELWGVDIGSGPIHWATMHLSPPLRFATTTTAPHLPFEQDSFDLIYSGSVFSHITDLADAWLLELRRILRPGGWMYLTVHDKNSMRLLLDVHQTKLARWLRRENDAHHFSSENFSKLVLSQTPKGAQTFYDIDFLRRVWGQHLEIVNVHPEAYGYQTALVLRKR